MDINALKNYRHLVGEAEDLAEEIASLENSRQCSVVRGSYPDYPYTQHSIKISGMDSDTVRLILEKRERRELIRSQIANILHFVEEISDGRVRRIVRLHYIRGYSWSQTARKMGSYNTADGVRKACKRFFEKK